ncbi:MAG: sugar phosphate isomerase/epimerase family protein [Actinomycetota bacterium]
MKMRLSVITDELGQDLPLALDVCEEMRVKVVELRALWDANVVEHPDDVLKGVKDELDRRGMEVCSIASPFLKCHIEGDGAAEGDMHSATPLGPADQWGVFDRSLEVAHLFGAPYVRTFSFWRLEDPSRARGELTGVFREAAERAARSDLSVVLENEHACNLATGEEVAQVLEGVPSGRFGVIWDPGNEAALDPAHFGGLGGYERVRERVMHVHLKDVDRRGNWVRIGSGVVDHPALLRRLREDGYEGALSIETHYTVQGDGARATRECVSMIRELSKRAGVELT